MVGRGTIGRPWIFEEMHHYLRTGELLPEKSFAWQADILKEHIEKSIEWLKDERKGIVHSRRHLANASAFKGIRDFKPTRIAMLRADNKEELFRIIDEIPEKFGIE